MPVSLALRVSSTTPEAGQTRADADQITNFKFLHGVAQTQLTTDSHADNTINEATKYAEVLLELSTEPQNKNLHHAIKLKLNCDTDETAVFEPIDV